jgi:hypothetical protein
MPAPSYKKETRGYTVTNVSTGKTEKIPKGELKAITQLITKYTTGATDYTTNTHSHTIQRAITQQKAIGVDMMARGYIGKGWMDTVPTAWHPTQIMNRIQRMIWMEFFKLLWQNRN